MRLSALLIGLMISTLSLSQKTTTYYFHVANSTIKKKVFNDSLSFKKEKQAAEDLMRLSGYTGLQLKDSLRKKSTLHLYYNFTHHFKKVKLNCLNCRREDLEAEKNYANAARTLDEKLTELENRGFPFASVKIAQQEEKDETLTLSYVIDSGMYFFIDKIHIKSEDKIHDKTLLTLVNIKEGDHYNERRIRNVREILDESPYYKLKRDPEVLFKKGKAELFLYVEKKKSSNADGFIGFNQDPDTRKLVFNGNINLSLRNAFNRAEMLDLAWKSSPDKTQNLNGLFRLPYLFGSPIGVGAKMNLQKQDTSFIKSDIWFEVAYSHPRFTFTVFDQLEGSNTLSGSLPNGYRDYKKNTIGLQFDFRPKLPERLHFYHPVFSASGGVFNYRSDTIDDNKQKIANNKYSLGFGHTIDFLKYFHLKNRLSYTGLASSIDLSTNELIYYGGLRSVRGFYELELYGNDVWILNSEIEFQPIKALSMSLIYDYSIADQNETKLYTNSVGLGFALINRLSRLEIVVANGSVNGNSLDFTNTRIHIGFRSNF